MKPTIDTNIIIDYLSGIKQAKDELALYSTPYISIITWIETLVGANNDNEKESIKAFLKQFDIIQLNEKISEQAILCRQKYKLRLPDAIILATAEYNNSILITRDTKGFKQDAPNIRVPYKL